MKNLLVVLTLSNILMSCSNNDAEMNATIMTTAYLAQQMDEANKQEYNYGDALYNESCFEYIASRKDDQLSSRRTKIGEIQLHMDSIERACSEFIGLVEALKSKLLEKAGENLKQAKDQQMDQPVWRSYDPQRGCLPSQYNLKALKHGSETSEVQELLVSDDATTLTTNGKKLWEGLNRYRNAITRHVGTYSWSEYTFSVELPEMNQFQDNRMLRAQVEEQLERSNANLKEDKYAIVRLYVDLSKPEFQTLGGRQIHWVNASFENTSLLMALAKLTALENEALRARTYAYEHWQAKSGHCCYGFDEIIGFANGPSTVRVGEELNINVSVVARDSGKLPKVIVDGYPSEVNYEDGFGIVKLKPNKTGVQTFRGVVKMKNNSGTETTKSWEWTVNVLEPD